MLDDLEQLSYQYHKSYEAIIVVYHILDETLYHIYDGFFRVTNSKQARKLQKDLVMKQSESFDIRPCYSRLDNKFTYFIRRCEPFNRDILYKSILTIQKLN